MKIKDIKKNLNNSTNNKSQKKTLNTKKNEIPKNNKLLHFKKKHHHSNININNCNNNIDKNKEKYYVLSEEANDMIKSYSKKKKSIEKNIVLKKKCDFFEFSYKNKYPNNKYKKLHNKKNNSMIFNNSYFSLNTKKNLEKRENINFSESFDESNKKCIGINLTLSNIQNNNNKKQLKTIKNNKCSQSN